MKKILVIGGAGFIGANLLNDLLSEGYVAKAIVKRSTNLWRLDDLGISKNVLTINTQDFTEVNDLFCDFMPEIIYNFAEKGHHPKTFDAFHEHLNDSINTINNLLQASINSNVKLFVQAGSSLEYPKDTYIINESTTLRPNTYRGIIKAVESLLCEKLRNNEINIVIARIFRAYGPYEQFHRFIPQIFNSFINKESITLTNQNFKRDYIYIKDLTEALIRIIDNKKVNNQILNLATGKTFNVFNIYKILSKLYGYDIKIKEETFMETPADSKKFDADITETSKLLNWKPRFSLEMGLKQTKAWFENKLSLYE